MHVGCLGWARSRMSSKQIYSKQTCADSGLVCVLQGNYDVKFLVDGQWRLTPHWPTRDDTTGSTNNVLRIE